MVVGRKKRMPVVEKWNLEETRKEKVRESLRKIAHWKVPSIRKYTVPI